MAPHLTSESYSNISKMMGLGKRVSHFKLSPILGVYIYISDEIIYMSNQDILEVQDRPNKSAWSLKMIHDG